MKKQDLKVKVRKMLKRKSTRLIPPKPAPRYDDVFFDGVKKLLLTIAVILICSTAYASPFIVCDPYPASASVDQFVLTMDGATITVDAKVADNGSTSLYYDVGSIASGTHTLTAKAKCSLWGVESNSSAPFVFTRPAGSINAPAGIGLVK